MMIKKKMLKVVKNIAKEVAIRGGGIPSRWGFYETKIPSQVLEEVKKRQAKKDKKCGNRFS